LPSAGQIAPKIYADWVLRSRGAQGRVPRLAQMGYSAYRRSRPLSR
jgi:hypothetical protein